MRTYIIIVASHISFLLPAEKDRLDDAHLKSRKGKED